MRWISKKFLPAIQGLKEAIKDSSIRIQMLIGTTVILFGLIYEFDPREWMWILLCIFLVIISEVFNTAIEKLCNIVDNKENDAIRIVKDLSALAVLLSAIFSVLIGIMILKGELR